MKYVERALVWIGCLLFFGGLLWFRYLAFSWTTIGLCGVTMAAGAVVAITGARAWPRVLESLRRSDGGAGS